MWIQLGVTSRRCGHPCPVYAMHRAKGMRCSTFYLNFIQSLILNTLIFCLTLQDGMYTLSMAVESEFNLSCRALSLSIPIDTPDVVYEHISIPYALTSTLPPATITATTKTTPPRRSSTSTSSIQKFQKLLLPYYIPGQPDFKPVPPSYPLLLFPPNIPPTILPQSPKIVGPPIAINQRPQAHVYTKRPQTWYPKPSLGLTRVPTHQSAAGPRYPRKHLLPPNEVPTAPIAPLLTPDRPQDELQWATMFPPSEMGYPLYPGKPEFVTPSSAVFPQVLHWPRHSQTQQRPSEPHAPPNPEPEPPTPAPTRKTGPQLLRYPWYKPFPPHRSEIPPVPKNKMVSTSGAVASKSTSYSERSEQVEKLQASELPHRNVVKGAPMSLYFGLTPNTYPTPSIPKFPDVYHTPAPIEASPNHISSSQAHSFHCPAFCPGPPSVFYHHHDHHHFSHPLQMSNIDISSASAIAGQMLSSPVISPDSNLFPLIKGKGYNYGPLYTKTALPQTSDHTAMHYLVENPPIKSNNALDTSKHFTGQTMRPYIFRKLESTAASPQPTMKPANFASGIRQRSQNRPVADPHGYANHSPNPAVNQAEMQQYVYPMGRDTQSMLLAPNNVPSFEEMVQHDISSKPYMPPTHEKNAFMNYWNHAANLNSKPPRSNSLTKDTFTQMSLPQPPNNHNPFEPSTMSIQPKETDDKNPSPQLSFHPLIQSRNSVSVRNPQLYFPPNGESVDPVFRGPNLFNTHWVPAVQSNKGALLSSSQTDGRWTSFRCTINWPKWCSITIVKVIFYICLYRLYGTSIHCRRSNVERWKWCKLIIKVKWKNCYLLFF